MKGVSIDAIALQELLGCAGFRAKQGIGVMQNQLVDLTSDEMVSVSGGETGSFSNQGGYTYPSRSDFSGVGSFWGALMSAMDELAYD